MKRTRSGPYQTAAWQRRRAAHLADQPLCVYCERMGRVTVATVADHIVPHRGDINAFWHGALQSLCASCHSGMKQQQERIGVARGSHLDGTPIDAAHHWHRG